MKRGIPVVMLLISPPGEIRLPPGGQRVKRSGATVVNDMPGACQSCGVDRAAARAPAAGVPRSELAELWGFAAKRVRE